MLKKLQFPSPRDRAGSAPRVFIFCFDLIIRLELNFEIHVCEYKCIEYVLDIKIFMIYPYSLCIT